MTFLRGEGCGFLSKEFKSFVHCLSDGWYLWSGVQAERFVKLIFVISSN